MRLGFARTREVEDRYGHLLPSGAWYEGGADRRLLDDAGYRRVSRALDVVLSLAALPFAVPILAVCALAIKVDSPGPVFFVQRRTGEGGKRFPMLKLRTMVEDAEQMKEEVAELNELGPPDFKASNDPRFTRVGRILRKTSLDELPQLFNVLRGEMALVGPRPTSFRPEEYSLWHTARLDVRPGLTGLWQVSGRSRLEFDERLRLDIAYIRNRSLWLDAAIILRTFRAVASGRGAT